MGLQPKTVTIEIVFPSMEISKWQEHFQSERQKICRKHHLSLSVQSYLDFISHRLNGPKLEIKVTSQPIDYIPGYTSGFIARGNAWIKTEKDSGWPSFYTIHIIKREGIKPHTALILDLMDFLSNRSGCPTQAALRQAVRRLCESRITAKTAQTAR